MTQQSCGSCKFWCKIPLQPKGGECRVKPPTIVMLPGPDGQLVIGGAFPPTSDTHWCGEYQLKVRQP